MVRGSTCARTTLQHTNKCAEQRNESESEGKGTLCQVNVKTYCSAKEENCPKHVFTAIMQFAVGFGLLCSGKRLRGICMNVYGDVVTAAVGRLLSIGLSPTCFITF